MFTLIVTGTICPPSNVPFLKIRNETLRYEEYRTSIFKLMESKYIQKLIFCENSNSQIEIDQFHKKASIHNKQFEYITFEGDYEKIESFGKGYGEGELLLYALSRSILIQNENYFFKLTGRLGISNIDDILKKSKEDINYFNRIDFFKKNRKVDTRFYGVNICDYLRHFSDAYKTVRDNEGRFLEHTFYDRLCGNSIPHKSTVLYPRFTGISGSSGKSYEISKPSFFIKNMLTKICDLKIR